MSPPRLTTPRARTATLSAIVILAAILRTAFLSKESLWLDEFGSWWFSSGDLNRALTAEVTNPPLYYLLLHFWIQLFGTGESALRSLSVLPGVAAVPLTYLLGRRLFSSQVGLVAALYQAVSSFHVYYAQEARTFALLVFFILLSTWILTEALAAPRSLVIPWLAAYALAATVSLYLHFITVFFFAAQALYVALRQPRAVRTMLFYAASAFVAGLLFLPWLTTMLTAAAHGRQVRRHLFLKLPQALFSFLFGDTLIPLDERAVQNIAGTLIAYLPILLTALAASVILLPFCIAAFRRARDGALLTAIMAGVPVLLSFLVSFRVMLFDERYLIAASPFLYLAVAAGVEEVFRRSPDGRARFLAGLGATAVAAYAALVLLALFNYYFNPRFGREQWREAVAALESRGATSDLIVFDPDFLRHCYAYYGRKKIPYLALEDNDRRAFLAGDQKRIDELGSRRRIWLVQAHYNDDQVLAKMRAMFTESGITLVYPKAKGIEIHEFSRRE